MQSWFLGMFFVGIGVAMTASASGDDMLTLDARSQVADGKSADGSAKFKTVEKKLTWEPKKTAVIICDMWDDHWCKGAAARVAEMAPAMNNVVAEVRKRGAFVIHAPSTCMEFYKDTPQRKRAKEAKFAKTPVPLAISQRWGTAWCWPDETNEPALPIDDSDMGCDCKEKCKIRDPWKRQIATIDIADEDAITDIGQETYNLLTERKIDNVVMMGVHLNMCVLGRPFAIRQLTKLGKNVVLVRDMTDTMYNSQMPPKVDHFTGTDLVVGHVERYFCPSITSADLVGADLTGGKPFRFREDRR
ncbi:MAG: protein-signal peptide and transmembrane prediction [Planctomycetota bacterium]|nr:MAG: protein-signal peptide and transmembrane prediction [Planctomycetota bacterium]